VYVETQANRLKQEDSELQVRGEEDAKRSGHTIIGNIGDQWADLTKQSPGRRTFKLPNPLYYKI
ncbi:unnamed protein product, partial [Arabidopsis halleri]